MLGTEFVVFKNSEGHYSVMKNQCAHMGAPLSHGTLKDGCIVCPFHSFKYNQSGECVEMPADHDLKSKYKVAAYPAFEKWGEIWFFYGENPSYNLDVFSAINGMTYFHLPRARFRPHFHAMVPNAMDLNHFKTVHGMTVDKYEVSESDMYLKAEMRFIVEKNAPFIFRLFGHKKLEIDFTTYGANNYLVELKSPVKFSFLTSYCQHNKGGTWTASVVAFPKFSFFKKWSGWGLIDSFLKTRMISDFFADDEKWINYIKFKPRFIPSDRHYLSYQKLCNRQKVGGSFEIENEFAHKNKQTK